MSKGAKSVLVIALAAAVVMIVAVILKATLFRSPNISEITLAELTELIEQDEIDAIQVDEFVYFGVQDGEVRFKAIGPRGENNALTNSFWKIVDQKKISVMYK